MKSFAIFAAVVLSFAHSVASGQAPDSTSLVGRWYVGGGAATHHYFTINEPYSLVKPAYLMGGYVFKPRLAVQAEMQYGRKTEEFDNGYSVINGEVVNFRSESKTTSVAMTLLARFSRSRPQRHLQFDWLLGLAIVSGSLNETITQTSATRSESYIFPTRSKTEPHLVGGISLRYLVGPRLAVGMELLANKNLFILPYGYGIFPGGGVNLGISYLLGSR